MRPDLQPRHPTQAPLASAPGSPQRASLALFRGFTDDLYGFFEELADNNDREWFFAHRDRYLRSVRRPLEALLAELEPDFGTGKVFRINRDVRFSADKSPYKTTQAALIELGRRGCLYLHVSAEGILVGGGAPNFDASQLARFRDAVDGPPGSALVELIDRLRQESFEVGTVVGGTVTAAGDLKRVPRPFPTDHPRAALLKLKRLLAARSFARPEWLEASTAIGEVRAAWRQLRPLSDWLGEHVGESSGVGR